MNTIAFPFKMIEPYRFSVNLDKHKSSHLEVFCKKVVLKNFSKFLGKHLLQRLFSNKVLDWGLQLRQSIPGVMVSDRPPTPASPQALFRVKVIVSEYGFPKSKTF